MTQESEVKQGDKIIVYVDAELKELIPGFLENRHRDIKSILEALEHIDYKTIRILGHNMKGSGGGFGFDTITNIGRSLEQAAEDRDIQEIRRLANELLTFLECVDVVYE